MNCGGAVKVMTKYLVASGFFLLASAAFPQYTMNLTGVGDAVVFDNVYVSPYVGTIQQGNTTLYTGYMICDDFVTDSFLNTPWNAAATTAALGNGKFQGETYTIGKTTYNSQQMYDAVAYLATNLVNGLSGLNSQQQTDYSFAIWDIMDPSLNINPYGNALNLISQAFAAGAVDAANVDVFTANPDVNISQEFLVVNGPKVVRAAESSSVVLLAANLLAVLALFFVLRRRRAQA